MNLRERDSNFDHRQAATEKANDDDLLNQRLKPSLRLPRYARNAMLAHNQDGRRQRFFGVFALPFINMAISCARK